MLSCFTQIKKLQKALNHKGLRITVSTSQFWSATEQKAINVYYVYGNEMDFEAQKSVQIELFRSASQVYIILFLRDIWYTLNGVEIPEEEEGFLAKKSKYNDVVNKYLEEFIN